MSIEIDNANDLIKGSSRNITPTRFYNFSSSSDIAIPAKASAANIGNSHSIYIPTNGCIFIAGVNAIINVSNSNIINTYLGIKIGSTVYDFVKQSSVNDTLDLIHNTSYMGNGGGNLDGGSNSNAYISNTNKSGTLVETMVSVYSLPTGMQTVSLVCYEKDGENGGTLKGTVRTTSITLGVEDWT